MKIKQFFNGSKCLALGVLLLTILGCQEYVKQLELRKSAHNEKRSPKANTRKSYADFLSAIRAFESDISPDSAAVYESGYFDPNAVNYPQVEYPGRVVRDINGNPVYTTTSYKGFFIKIGVDSLYTYGSRDTEMFKRMQYSVINFLGFVGYQFSEQDLWDLGYYTHYDENHLKEYYSDLPNATWANGVRDTIINDIHITDVNTWRGQFTGNHGIRSFADFRMPELQGFIALDHFKFKHDRIVKLLKQQGRTIQDFIGTTLYWDQCIPSISPPPGHRSMQCKLPCRAYWQVLI